MYSAKTRKLYSELFKAAFEKTAQIFSVGFEGGLLPTEEVVEK